MAEAEAQTDAAAAPAAASGPGLIAWLAVGTLAAGLGAAVPLAASMLAPPPEVPKAPEPYNASPMPDEMTFLTYGDATVNLDEGRMNRYLRVKIALHIRKSDEAIVKKAIASKELILRNWLLSNLSDKVLDDIRGKAGQNMLRREIRDYFNATLFPDNYERVYDVLFEEFNVQ